MRSLFQVLEKNHLTSFEIIYNHKTDRFELKAAREWDESFDFSEYSKNFTTENLICETSKFLGNSEAMELLKKENAMDYYREIEELIRQGKHETVKLFYFRRYNAKFTCFEHSTKIGRHNKSQALTCGGIRRHKSEISEKDVFIDGLNLGRAMTYKNMAAKIPFGGCKITLQIDDMDLSNKDFLGFLAYATDRCRAVTAPDMNLPAELTDAIVGQGLSLQYVGGNNSRTGKTGRPTAYGVYLSLKEAVRFKEGLTSLAGKRVTLIGLGAVGWNLGEFLLRENVELTISDINEERMLEFVSTFSEHHVKIVDAREALLRETDIISPCAAGGVFNEENIKLLNCRYIWGSANNQLQATDKKKEIELAKMIADRGIIYQSEWWHNSAGVICMAEEYLNNSTPDQVLERVEQIIPGSTYNNLKEADEKNICPTENCYEKCEKVLYG